MIAASSGLAGSVGTASNGPTISLTRPRPCPSSSRRCRRSGGRAGSAPRPRRGRRGWALSGEARSARRSRRRSSPAPIARPLWPLRPGPARGRGAAGRPRRRPDAAGSPGSRGRTACCRGRPRRRTRSTRAGTSPAGSCGRTAARAGPGRRDDRRATWSAARSSPAGTRRGCTTSRGRRTSVRRSSRRRSRRGRPRRRSGIREHGGVACRGSGSGRRTATCRS